MIPGPDQIIACPKCKGTGRYMTLVSGNTVGARIWSDGRQVAPMLPLPPVVVKCQHCSECYWLADAQKIGDVDDPEDQGKSANLVREKVLEIEEPTESEYYDAIERGMAKDATQERNLRVMAWWRRNDEFRVIEHEKPKEDCHISDGCRENLEALISLLADEDVTDHLMKVEVMRELGEFESAKEMLNHIKLPEVESVVRQFQTLCEERDNCVRELHFDR